MSRRRKAWLWNRTGRRPGRPGYYARYYDYAADGRRISRSHHFLTHRTAAKWVRDFNARLDLRLIGEVVPMRLDECSLEFLAGCAALAKGTQTHYRTSVNFLYASVGDVDVHEITGAMIDRFIADRMKVSTSDTAAKHLRGANRFFVWAISRGYTDRNPIDAATARPRETDGTRSRPAISFDDLERLVGALKTEDRRMAVWIAMTTGMDRRDIERLTPQHVFMDDRAFVIVRPKTGKRRVLPMHDSIVPFLAGRLAETSPDQPVLRGLSRQGKDRDWWKLATESVGLGSLWFRDLRAVASTRLQRDAGLSLLDAQRLLGHASAATTAKHYHIPDPRTREALSRLPLPGFPASPESKPTKRTGASRQSS